MRITKGQRVKYEDNPNWAKSGKVYYGTVVGKVFKNGVWYVHVNFDDGENADYNGNFELHRISDGFFSLVGA